MIINEKENVRKKTFSFFIERQPSMLFDKSNDHFLLIRPEYIISSATFVILIR